MPSVRDESSYLVGLPVMDDRGACPEAKGQAGCLYFAKVDSRKSQWERLLSRIKPDIAVQLR